MKRIFIAFLLAVAAVSSGLAAPEAQERAEVYYYIGVEFCRSCHAREDKNAGPKLKTCFSWVGSAHANAWEKLPEEDRNNPDCLRCHTTGYGLPRRAGISEKDLRGVQCEACHGPGSGYFTWRVMKDPVKAREFGLWDPTKEICQKCHW